MQKMQTQSRTSRVRIAGAGILLAAIYAVAALVGGDPGQAVFGFVTIGGLAIFLAFSNREWAVIQSGSADERERGIDRDATELSYMAILMVAMIGGLYELAHGNYGPFGVICTVAGFSRMLAISYVKRRR